MRWIVGWSIRFRRLIVFAVIGVVAFAALQLDDVRPDALPEFGRTTVEVQTEALGLSAEEVEQLITVPLEQDLLNGVAFLEDIRSVSLPGLSSIVMTFEPGTDLLDARQVVAERLTQAVGVAGLPHVADLPQMIQPLSSMSRVALVQLTSDDLSSIEMSLLAHWRIVPGLMGVEGVANVSIWGFRDRQLQVLVDPATLHGMGVTLHDVIRTVGNALEVSTLSFLEASSPGTGGWVEMPNQRLHVFHEQAITTAEELAEVPVERADSGGAVPPVGAEPGAPAVALDDVAEVVEDHQPLIGDTVCPDGECLLLAVERFPGANTVEVIEGVEDTLETLAPGLEGMQAELSTYRPAEYVDAAVGNLGRTFAIGGVLLLIVLALLLPSWRSVAVAAIAVVASVAAAWLVLVLRGAPIDLLLLAGLAAGLLVVIDDAVTDPSEISRRLRSDASGEGVPRWRVILESGLSVRTAMLYALLIAAVVTIPAFVMGGESGVFLSPIAVGFLLALGAAMLTALTVTPALSMLLAGPGPDREAIAFRWVRGARERASLAKVSRPAAALAVAAVLAVVGLAVVPFLDVDTHPSLHDGDLQVDIRSAPGTSLPAMDALTTQAVDALADVPGVEAVVGYVGRAVTSEQRVNVNASQVWLHLADDADRDATIERIRSVVGGLGDATAQVRSYADARITELLGSSDHDVVVRVFGEDPDVLLRKSAEIHDLVAGVDGVTNASMETAPTEPAVVIRADVEAAREFGIKPGDVRRTAATLVSGLTVGNLFDEQKVFDAVVWGVPEIRETPDDIGNLLIDAPDGSQVRLDQVASVAVVDRPAEIRHDSVRTYIDVTADVSGRDVGDVASEVEAAIASVEFPLEHHAELVVDDEGGAADGDVVPVVIAALLGIFLLLQAALASWRAAAIVFVSLPLALVGGAVAVLASGGDVTLGAIAGALAVFTFATRAAIMLVTSTRAEASDETRDPMTAAQRAIGMRWRPIVTTAIAAIAVALPAAIGSVAPGLEFVQPLARVVIGGVVTTVAVLLVVLPAAIARVPIAAPTGVESEDLVVVPDAELARP